MKSSVEKQSISLSSSETMELIDVLKKSDSDFADRLSKQIEGIFSMLHMLRGGSFHFDFEDPEEGDVPF